MAAPKLCEACWRKTADAKINHVPVCKLCAVQAHLRLAQQLLDELKGEA
jgi:hypothetical protein